LREGKKKKKKTKKTVKATKKQKKHEKKAFQKMGVKNRMSHCDFFPPIIPVRYNNKTQKMGVKKKNVPL
jgi:hypothetical protein